MLEAIKFKGLVIAVIFIFTAALSIALAFVVKSWLTIKKKRYKLPLTVAGLFLTVCLLWALASLTTAGMAAIADYSRERYKKHKPTEYYVIKEEYGKQPAENIKHEYVVVSNPPKDSLQLREKIEKYNSQSISVDTLKKYGKLERTFYRETGCLTRNYEEGRPYPKPYWWGGKCPGEYDIDKNNEKQHIGHIGHKKDCLVKTVYNYSSDNSYRAYYYNYLTGDEKIIRNGDFIF